MKSLLRLYQGVGTGVQTQVLNRHAPFVLDGPKPPSWGTPGRLQYYRAENEVFLPGKPHNPANLLLSFLYLPTLLSFLLLRRDQVADPHA